MTGSSPTREAAMRRLLDSRAGTATAVLRILTGLVFVLFSLPKFLLHDFELAEFVRFGLPESSLLVYLVGLLELGGGLMLLAGFLTRLAAAGLAANMAGAVATAGVTVGGPIHLGLAPALLVAALYLVWAGSGPAAVDRRLTRSAGRQRAAES
jgi:putative oxidoreductase